MIEEHTPVENSHRVVECFRRKTLFDESLSICDQGYFGWEVDVGDSDWSGSAYVSTGLEDLLSADGDGGPSVGLSFVGRHHFTDLVI
jgi:hypothetical protein